MTRKHVMLRRDQMYHAGRSPERLAKFVAPAVTGYDYPMSPVGKAANVTVDVATSLGPMGQALATKVLLGCEADLQLVQSWFGASVKIPPVNLLIAPLSGSDDGSGGAYHYSCSGTDLYCDDDEQDDGSTTLSLFVAELSEVGQAAQNGGWDCGSSNGEALSRVHAETAHPGVLDGYSTAAAWLDSPRADWISKSEPTDQDAVSTGCGVLFINWLLSQDFTLSAITQSASSTLAGTYKILGQMDNAFATFRAACQKRWPVGKPSGVTTDNPWGVPSPPNPPPPPPGPPPPPPRPPRPAASVVTLTGTDPAGQYLLVPVDTVRQLNDLLASIMAARK